MTKIIGIGLVIIILGWIGFATLGHKDADSDAMMQEESSMMDTNGDTMMDTEAQMPAGDTMMNETSGTMMTQDAMVAY